MTECHYCSMISAGERVVDSNEDAVAILERPSDDPKQIVVLSRRHELAFFLLHGAEQLAVLHMAQKAGLRLAESDPRIAVKLEIPCTLTSDEEVAHARVLVVAELVEPAPDSDASPEDEAAPSGEAPAVSDAPPQADAPADSDGVEEEAEPQEEMSMFERCMAIGVDYGRLSRIYTDEQLEKLLDL